MSKMTLESVQVVVRQVSAFSRTLDRLIMALEDSGNPMIEMVFVGSMMTMAVDRGPWQGLAHNDDNNRTPAFGVVQADRMKSPYNPRPRILLLHLT